MMLSFKKTLLVVSIVASLVFAGVVFAQEDTDSEAVVTSATITLELDADNQESTDESTTEENYSDSEMSEADTEAVVETSDSEMTMDIEFSAELTEEEAIEILETTDEITEEELETVIVVGDVVVVSDDFVVVETADDELVKIATSSRSQAQRKKTGSFVGVNKLKAGNTVTLVPTKKTYTISINRPTVTSQSVVDTNGKTYAISSQTTIVKNGEEISVDTIGEVDEDATVTVITDEDDNVLAVTILDTVEEETNKRTGLWIILALVVVFGGAYAMRKKPSQQS